MPLNFNGLQNKDEIYSGPGRGAIATFPGADSERKFTNVGQASVSCYDF